MTASTGFASSSAEKDDTDEPWSTDDADVESDKLARDPRCRLDVPLAPPLLELVFFVRVVALLLER